MKNNLHNHGGELPDGVPARRNFNEGGAEKFIEWAKKEKLSLWK